MLIIVILELSSDATKYVVVEERLTELQRKKWKDAKMKKLEYYIANINPECCVLCKGKKAY